jgi:hypothetical protein
MDFGKTLSVGLFGRTARAAVERAKTSRAARKIGLLTAGLTCLLSIGMTVPSTMAQAVGSAPSYSEQWLRGGDGQDAFGTAVAMNGEFIVVGAPDQAVNGNAAQGAVFVFTKIPCSPAFGQHYCLPWSQLAELTEQNGAAGDHFGDSVSLSGTTIVIGAPGSNGGRGAAYVFSGSKWVVQTEINAGDGGAGDAFGTSVSVNGTTVIVGAPGHQVGSAAAEGAAYLFGKSGSSWTSQGELTPSGGTEGGGFGTSVAIYSTTAVVGAPGSADGNGSAYAYAKVRASWTQTAEFTNFATVPHSGAAVATDGSTIVVGSPGNPPSIPSGSGAVTMFERTGTPTNPSWKLQGTIEGGQEPIELGAGLAIQGTEFVASAPGDDSAVIFNEAAGSPSGWKAGVAMGDDSGLTHLSGSVSVSGSTVALGNPGGEDVLLFKVTSSSL